MKPLVLTVQDVAWLRKVRISPHDVCVICGGEGRLSERLTCTVCHGTGVRPSADTPTPDRQCE